MKLSSNNVGFLSLILSKFLILSFGNNTNLTPAFFAPCNFSSNPPISVTSPFKLISPVIAISFLILLLVKIEYKTTVKAVPALGPSLGTAPSGQCK